MNTQIKAELAYTLIAQKSWKNIAIQAGAGFFGFPFTLAADAAVIPLVYVPLWNEIRAIYGYGEIEDEQVKAMISAVGPLILVDVIIDETISHFAVLGLPSNFLCAKVLTWRLGTLFTFFASRGEDFDGELAEAAIEFLTLVFPKQDFGFFKSPDRQRFVELLTNTRHGSKHQVYGRLNQAMAVLRGD